MAILSIFISLGEKPLHYSIERICTGWQIGHKQEVKDNDRQGNMFLFAKLKDHFACNQLQLGKLMEGLWYRSPNYSNRTLQAELNTISDAITDAAVCKRFAHLHYAY